MSANSVLGPPGSFLSGIRVLDMSNYLPGPLCTQILADFGADVVKLERPGGGDPMRQLDPLKGIADATGGSDVNPAYQVLNEGKKIVFLNGKEETADLHRLVQQADVLVDSFRPGVLKRWKLGEEDLQKLKAESSGHLIHCTLFGYNPQSSRGSHDINFLAQSGALSQITDSNGKPVIPFPPIADQCCAVYAANAIIAALFQRYRSSCSGGYSHITACLQDAIAAWQSWGFTSKLCDSRRGILNGGAACYNVYETSDKKHIALGSLEGVFWRRFCERIATIDEFKDVVEQCEWIATGDCTSRVFGKFESLPQDGLISQVSKVILRKPRQFWTEIFETVDCCFSPVLSHSEGLEFLRSSSSAKFIDSGNVCTGVLFPVTFNSHVASKRPPMVEIEVENAFR